MILELMTIVLCSAIAYYVIFEVLLALPLWAIFALLSIFYFAFSYFCDKEEKKVAAKIIEKEVLKGSPGGDPEGESSEVPEDDDEVGDVSETPIPTPVPAFDFSVVKLESQDSNLPIKNITYKKFKKLITEDEFINSFTEAIKLNLKHKKVVYRKLQKQFKKDELLLKSGRRGVPEDDTGSILKKISLILNNIKALEITPDYVKQNLHALLHDRDNGLESLTGQVPVKNFLANRLYNFSRNPLIFFNKFQNIRIYAGSGYGKTKIAQVIGFVFGKAGILVDGNMIQATRASLIASYVGQTAPKTRHVLISTLESVLFIDEAYNLAGGKGHHEDYSQEAIVELINFIDKMIGLNIIIVAGYRNLMETQFMQSNEGLERRFLKPLILEPYSPKDLSNMLIRFIHQSYPTLEITQEQANYIYSVIKNKLDNNPKAFEKQAGDMLNISDNISQLICANDWDIYYATIINTVFK